MSKARLEFDERELADDDVSSGGETDAAVTVTTTNIPTSPVRRGGEHGNSDSSNDNEKAWSQPPRDVRGRGTSNEQEQQQREESQRSQKRTHQDIGCNMEEKEDDAVQPRHSKKSRHGHDNHDGTSTSTTSSNNTYMGRRDSSVYKVMVKSILGSQASTEEPGANEELLAGYLDLNGPAASDSDETLTRPNSSCSEDTPALASQSSSSVAEAAVTKSLAKLEVNNNNNKSSNSKDPLTSHKLSILKEELLAHGIVIRKDGTLEDLNEATSKHANSQPLDGPQKHSLSSSTISQAQAKLLEQKINALILERNQVQNDCRLWESKYNDLKLVQRTKVQQTVTQLQQQVQEKDEQLLAQQQGTQKMKLKFQQVAQVAKQQITLLKRENATLKREYQTLRLNQSNQRPPSPISQALERRINELIQERDQLQAHANSHQSQVRTLQRQVSQLQQQVQEKDQIMLSRQTHYPTNHGGGDNNYHSLMQENDRLKQENYRLLQQLQSQKRRHDIFAMNFSEFEKASANMEAVGGFNSPPSS